VLVEENIITKHVGTLSMGDVDNNWAADTLSDDEIETSRPEAAVAPLLEEGELDADAIVVSPTGNSASAANNGTTRYYYTME
jgi:hypothetical protein